jgi:hypothetical protein
MWLPCFPIRKAEHSIVHITRYGHPFVQWYAGSTLLANWDPGHELVDTYE